MSVFLYINCVFDEQYTVVANILNTEGIKFGS